MKRLSSVFALRPAATNASALGTTLFELWSNSRDFVVLETSQLFGAAVYIPLPAHSCSPDGLGAEACDAHETVLTVRSTAHFTATETWGQIHYCKKDSHHGVWQWQGTRFEHKAR
jgi:hypothetical protein